MHWLPDVDSARAYLSHGRTKRNTKTGKDEPIVSRKVVYNMAAAGMKVARLGDTGRRILFCEEWIDEYLQQTTRQDEAVEPPIALVRSSGGGAT